MAGRILVCLDGSSFSDAGAKVALQILSNATDGSTLTGLHVVNVTKPTGNVLHDIKGRLGFEPAVASDDVVRSHEEQGRMVLQAFERDAEIAGHKVHTVLDHGAVTERILHHGKLFDMVILGVRGETEDRFPGQGGGHLEGIVRDLSVPTLFVTKDTPSITGVVVGYDGSEDAAEALKSGLRLAEIASVGVEIVYVSDEGEGQEHLDEALGACDLSAVTVGTSLVPRQEGRRGENLVNWAKAHHANVLAVGKLGQSAMRDFLYGGIVDDLLTTAPLMVLIVR